MSMSKLPKPGKQEFTVEGACNECLHLGWHAFNEDSEIQRCDNCAVFSDDYAALAYALRLAAKALKNPRRRSGRRFGQILIALETAAKKIHPEFWLGRSPNPHWIRGLVASMALEFSMLDGATGLSIAYRLQVEGFIHSPTNGENVEADNEYVQENLDRDRLGEILWDAGCEETPEGNWRVRKGYTV